MPTIKNTKGKEIEITQEQYDELFGKSGKAFRAWRAEYGQTYFFVDSRGIFLNTNDYNHESDNYRYLTSNYFSTKEEALAYKTIQEATGRVTHAIKEANGDWEAVWGGAINAKKNFSYRLFADIFATANNSTTSKEVHLLPYMKPDTAKKILEEHEEDLRVIFGV